MDQYSQGNAVPGGKSVEEQLRGDVYSKSRSLNDSRHHKDGEEKLTQVRGKPKPRLKEVAQHDTQAEQGKQRETRYQQKSLAAPLD